VARVEDRTRLDLLAKIGRRVDQEPALAVAAHGKRRLHSRHGMGVAGTRPATRFGVRVPLREAATGCGPRTTALMATVLDYDAAATPRLLHVGAGVGVDFHADSDLDNARCLPSHWRFSLLDAHVAETYGWPRFDACPGLPDLLSDFSIIEDGAASKSCGARDGTLQPASEHLPTGNRKRSTQNGTTFGNTAKVDRSGGLLIADDLANIVWRVSSNNAPSASNN
jgi:hypothetical protein